jgi:hypothetical protein
MPKSKSRKRARRSPTAPAKSSVFIPTRQDVLLLNQSLNASCRGRPERALQILSRLSQPAPYDLSRGLSEELHYWRQGTPLEVATVLLRVAAHWAAMAVPECGEYYASLFLCDCEEHSATELDLLAMRVARDDPLIHDLVLFEERLLEVFVEGFAKYWPRPEVAELLRRWVDAAPAVAHVSRKSDDRLTVRDLVTGRVHELAARPHPNVPDTFHVGRLVPTDEEPPTRWALLPPQLTDVEAHRHARQIRDGVPAEQRWANGSTFTHTMHGECPACINHAELAALTPDLDLGDGGCLRAFASSDLVRTYLDRLEA